MMLQPIIPKPQLAPFIRSFWIFESHLEKDTLISRTIVPNGCAKITLPLKNSLYVKNERLQQEHQEGKIKFVGISEEPVTIDTYDKDSGNLIVELTTQGAYRFASFAMKDVVNMIFSFDEVFGTEGKMLQERIGNTDNVLEKAELLQQFLLKKLTTLNHDQCIIDYTITAIQQSHGNISIRDLEKKTGYSKRYLSMLFHDFVGLTPKTVASIARFQYFHKLWALNPSPDFYRAELHRFYYDQAHFIKEFKRFSGLAPRQYAENDNEYGRVFYKE